MHIEVEAWGRKAPLLQVCAEVSFICKRAHLCIFGPGVNLDKDSFAEIEWGRTKVFEMCLIIGTVQCAMPPLVMGKKGQL